MSKETAEPSERHSEQAESHEGSGSQHPAPVAVDEKAAMQRRTMRRCVLATSRHGFTTHRRLGSPLLLQILRESSDGSLVRRDRASD